MLSDPSARVVTVTYSAIIADLPTLHRGDVVTNTAHAAWDLVPGPPPTSVTGPFDQVSINAAASVTILEPVPQHRQDRRPARPAPGETFDYHLDVSNLAGPNTSDAFNTTVVDTIPIGVVVDPASISDGGQLTGTGPVGGGTITWTLPGSLRPGATTSVSYPATLAPSASLTSAPLTNTAQITHYESLASGGRSYVGPVRHRDRHARLPARLAGQERERRAGVHRRVEVVHPDHHQRRRRHRPRHRRHRHPPAELDLRPR